MRIDRLHLADFRSHRDVDISFAPGLTAVLGDNGRGKTNLLEAISFVSRLGSFRGAPTDALVRVGADSATMEMQDGARYVRVTTKDGTERYRVTKVVGGHYREDFVGIGASPGGREHVLPATYVFATQSWRYKGYSLMVTERPDDFSGVAAYALNDDNAARLWEAGAGLIPWLRS